MEQLIITIGRQLGSGGRRIGKQLAEQLGLSFYDKELINIASQESGLCEDVFEQADEKKNRALFGNWFGLRSSLMNGDFQVNSCMSDESLFQIQSDVIRKLAERQSCVFVGRCADYILRENPRCINVFISAEIDDRIRRVSEMMQVSADKAKELIRQTDKKRPDYYNYYTNKEWGVAKSYHLCVNSSLLGETETLFFIIKYVQASICESS